MSYLHTGKLSEPVAIIGIGCRLPGSVNGPESFWNFLENRGDGIVEIPPSRWDWTGFYDSDPNAIMRATTRWGGFLDDVFGFDPAFFDISPREAESMDPQQRGLLQIVAQALQDAGLPISKANEHVTGVFVGISTSDFRSLREGDQLMESNEIYAGTGVALCIASNRISHRFNFRGPSYSLDTACSSSMVAVDQACKNINEGACELAVAAGVNLMLSPSAFIIFSKANMLSPTGRLSTFDSRANGYVRGEGFGAVVLKKLSKAVADGDRIYAVIRSTCVNQDGRTPTLTSPSQDAQMAMLRSLCAAGGVSPEDVGYVEAHGTGTPTGDPIEAGAIGRVFGIGRARNPVLIGSVKPNVGHLESAAGITGLIKAALVVHKRRVPPNINFEKPNPRIPFDVLNIEVPLEVKPLPASESGESYAVVNSFGFGGTNASALLQSYQPYTNGVAKHAVSKPSSLAVLPAVVPLAATTPEALKVYAGRISQSLHDGASLADAGLGDIALTLAKTRDRLAKRAAIIATSPADLKAQLDILAGTAEAPTPGPDDPIKLINGQAVAQPRIAFTFSGQGSQWWGMGRKLLKEHPIYRKALEEFDAIFKGIGGWSVIEALLADEENSRVDDSTVTQPTLCALQIGLAKLWQHYGIVPDVVIGHSLGEAAAAHVAGILDLETTVRYIEKRARIRHHLNGAKGAMAAIGLSAAEVAPMLPDDGSIQIGGYNGPAMVSITGGHDAVHAFAQKIENERPGVLSRILKTDTAWHSYQLAAGEQWFRKEVGEIKYQTPTIPMISTVSGMLETCFDIDYWWSNLQQPVRYNQAIDFALDYGINIFLELAPHQTLSGLTSGCAAAKSKKVAIISSLNRKKDDYESIATAAANLFIQGVEPDWQTLLPDAHQISGIPTYPWMEAKLDKLSESSKHFLFKPPVHPLLGKREQSAQPSWRAMINVKAFPFIADHVLQGEYLYPAAGYIEMMLAAAMDFFSKGPIELKDIKIFEALFIRKDDDVMLRTHLDPDRGIVRVFSHLRDGSGEWVLRAQSKAKQRDVAPPPPRPGDASTYNPIDRIDHDRWYRSVDAIDFVTYGPAFKVLKHVHFISTGSLSEVIAHDSVKSTLERYHAHPVMVDACMQLNDWNLARELDPTNSVFDKDGNFIGDTKYLPVGIKRLRLFSPLPAELTIETAWELVNNQAVRANNIFRDLDGNALMTIEHVIVQGVPVTKGQTGAGQSAGEVLRETFHALPALTEEAEPSEEPSGNWLVFSDKRGRTSALIAELKGRGATVEEVREPGSEFSTLAELRAIADAHLDVSGGQRGVIFAWSLGHEDLAGDVGTDSVLAQSERHILALTALGQALEALKEPASAPKIWILTNGARQLPDQAPISLRGLTQSPLTALTRALTSECEFYRLAQIDLDDAEVETPSAVADLLLKGSPETELVIRGGKTFVSRIDRDKITTLPAKRKRISGGDLNQNFLITMDSPGVLDALELRETEVPAPGPDEVLLEVAAVGLNFRDIMAATGLLPKEAEPDEAYRNLGLEYGGIVRAVGQNVSHVKVGDRVMGMGRRCLQRLKTVHGATVTRISDHLPLEAASTIPSAFVTAHFALNHVARLSKGETVLIHVATGGVGLAAIQLAKRAGAEIFATAGSESKRAYLRDLGIKHVMNSRSLDFADEIRDLTGGKGVDVVLNSLPGAFIEEGLEVLAPYGRFIEIGKRDVYADTPFGLKALRKNIQLAVLDLAALGLERPDYMMRMLGELTELFDKREIEPLPFTEFKASKVADAFRFMSQAKHIGKVVVSFDEPELEIAIDTAKPFALDAGGTYLVTGASRGFGISVADWLSTAGAGKIVLCSRSGTVAEDETARVDTIAERGTEIQSVALDVTDAAAVEALVAELGSSSKPLRGIIHGAAVIDDAFLSQLDDDQVLRVVRPKVAGAWNLHRALEKTSTSVDFLVSFSSTSQLFGARGQSNYAAANAFLDAFAHYRAGLGKTALTVDWGPLGGAGFVARNESLASYLESMGLLLVPEEGATAALAGMLRRQVASIAYGAFDWPKFKRANTGIEHIPRLAPLITETKGTRTKVRAELAATPREKWPQLLQTFLVGEIAKVLKVDVGNVPAERPLSELGLDSLSSFELKSRIEDELDLGLPVSKFLQAPTIAKLSDAIGELLAEKMASEEAAADAQDSATDASGSAKTAADKPLLPSDRQLGLLALTSASMTSLEAKQALTLRVAARFEGPVDTDRLGEAVKAVVQRHPSLRFSVPAGGAVDALALQAGSAPVLAVTGHEVPVDEAAGTTTKFFTEFRLTPNDTGGSVLEICAHRAVADRTSLNMVLGEVLQFYAEEDLPSAPTERAVLSHLDSRRYDDERPQAVSDRAFWYELLNPPPKALSFGPRQRSLAPAGFGRNQGTAQTITVTLDFDGITTAEREAALITASGIALARLTGEDSLVIDYIDAGRPSAETELFAASLETELPVPMRALNSLPIKDTLARTQRWLTAAKSHRGFDLFSIEKFMQHELVTAGAYLPQIALTCVEQAAKVESDENQSFKFVEMPQQGCLHDLHLACVVEPVSRTGKLVLTFDTGAIQKDFALRLADELAAALNEVADREVTTLLVATQAKLNGTSENVPSNLHSNSHAEESAVRAASLSNGHANGGTDYAASGKSSEPVVPDKLAAPKSLAAAPVTSVLSVLPVSDVQHYLLSSLERPDVTPAFARYWKLNQALRVNVSLDVRRLEQAFTKVAARHDALRMRFSKQSGGWKTLIESGHSTGLQVVDLGDVSDSKLASVLDAEASIPFDIERGPLFQLTLYKCGKRGDVLLISLHHLITDGWSLLLVIDELVRTYIGIPIFGAKPLSFADYLSKYEIPTDARRYEAYQAYWQQTLNPILPAPKLGRMTKGYVPNFTGANLGPTARLTAVLNQNGLAALTARARRSGATLSSLLTASFATTLAERGGAEGVYVNTAFAGREAPALHNFVGFVANLVPLRCDVAGASSIEQLASSINSQLRTSFQHCPSRAVFPNPEFEKKFVEAGAHMRQFVSTMSVPESLAKKSVLGSLLDLLQPGAKKRIGPLEFEMVNLPVSRLTFTELDLRTTETSRSIELALSHDLTAFSDSETRSIVMELLDKLAVDDAHVEDIRATGRLDGGEVEQGLIVRTDAKATGYPAVSPGAASPPSFGAPGASDAGQRASLSSPLDSEKQ